MKRLWISIKRGLIRDANHRVRMGECIWLFQYMLDVADWEAGVILDWKDQAAADDMQMPIRTLREQRRKLEEEGYISSLQKQYGQEITIKNWTNPRSYTGEVLNKKQGSNKAEPKKKESQGYIQGYTQGSSQDVTPTYDSKDKHQTSKEGETPKPLKANQIPEVVLFRAVVRRYPNHSNFDDVVKAVSGVSQRLGRDATAEDLKPFYSAWTSKGYKPTNLAWLEWAVSGQIPQNGKAANIQEPRGFQGIRDFIQEGQAIDAAQ